MSHVVPLWGRSRMRENRGAVARRGRGFLAPPCPQIVVTDASVGDEDADQPRDGRGQLRSRLLLSGLAGIFGRIASLTWGRTSQPSES